MNVFREQKNKTSYLTHPRPINYFILVFSLISQDIYSTSNRVDSNFPWCGDDLNVIVKANVEVTSLIIY